MADTMKEIHRRLSEFTFSEGYYYVDATKAFDESHEVCFGDEVHLTPAGYRILIDYIVNQVRLKGLSLSMAKGDKPTSPGPKSWPAEPASSVLVPQLVLSP